MLSDDEKEEMLADAESKERRDSFAKARATVLDKKLTGLQYLAFLQSVQYLFPQSKSFKRIEGLTFKL